MFFRKLKGLVIPLLSSMCLIGTGFGLWQFADNEFNGEASASVNILPDEIVNGELTISPLNTNLYQEYRVIFEQGEANDIYNEAVGISLVPEISFSFNTSLKLPNESQTDSYYYLKFEVETNNTAFNKYAEIVTTNDFCISDIEPKSDETSNTYDYTFSTSPSFKYQENMKPLNSKEYNTMLEELDKNKDTPITIKASVYIGGNNNEIQ